jgi:hypothetical protein
MADKKNKEKSNNKIMESSTLNSIRNKNNYILI